MVRASRGRDRIRLGLGLGLGPWAPTVRVSKARTTV